MDKELEALAVRLSGEALERCERLMWEYSRLVAEVRDLTSRYRHDPAQLWLGNHTQGVSHVADHRL